jgi:hypothetical protein
VTYFSYFSRNKCCCWNIISFHIKTHPRSQGLTADTALPEALAKTKTRSDLIGCVNTMECGNWTRSCINKYGWLKECVEVYYLSKEGEESFWSLKFAVYQWKFCINVLESCTKLGIGLFRDWNRQMTQNAKFTFYMRLRERLYSLNNCTNLQKLWVMSWIFLL